MAKLATVLLLHETQGASHYDWLLTDPADPDGLLWTARTDAPSDQWATLGKWSIEPIAPHRRHYLTYEGDIGQGRGTVRRVDEGTFEVIQWADQRIEIELETNNFRGRVAITPSQDNHWQARCVVS